MGNSEITICQAKIRTKETRITENMARMVKDAGD